MWHRFSDYTNNHALTLLLRSYLHGLRPSARLSIDDLPTKLCCLLINIRQRQFGSPTALLSALPPHCGKPYRKNSLSFQTRPYVIQPEILSYALNTAALLFATD